MLTDVWPLFGLVLRTPRLELRSPSPEQLAALAELADEGVHDPATMPFLVPWTDLPPGARGRSVVQHQRRQWGALTPQRWTLNFAVLAGGEPVGIQDVGGTEFAVSREVHTGSWLGRRHQGRGIGTEMRAAVLHFAFAGLGAEEALSGSYVDNPSSEGVSRRNGYVANGEVIRDREGEPARLRHWVLTRARWTPQRRDDIAIEGLDACLPFLT